MENFKERLQSHTNHVSNVGKHCTTEETTKQALILPLLDILGFNPYDPTKVRAEHGADFPGAKVGERVDYALFCHGIPVMLIEAKAWAQNLTNHSPQLSRYFNSSPEVTVAAITNGKEWRFFTDLEQKNIMDAAPFLKIKIEELADSDIDSLYQFRHEKFQPDALRTLAEESVYLSSFTKTISSSLRDVDVNFVKYVANHSGVSRQLNQRFIESITPIVRQAVEKAVSAMVLSGLSSTVEEKEYVPMESLEKVDPFAPIVDPENSKIVTTYTERLLFEQIQSIVGSEIELTYKDTENYFNVLYNNKSNRWIVRYFDNKQRPSILLPIPLTDSMKLEVARSGLEVGAGEQIIIDRPENVLRISGLVLDACHYCMNDENFKRK